MARNYYLFNYPKSVPDGVTLLTGIRGENCSSKLHITGGYVEADGDMKGLYYIGTRSGKGKWVEFQYPSRPGKSVTDTVFYGPDILRRGKIRAVGSYKTEETGPLDLGCLYEGSPDGKGEWLTLQPDVAGVKNTIAHSTSGDLVVGNYDTNLLSGFAFIYDIREKSYFTLKIKGADTQTAYGIWYEGCGHYIISGGYFVGTREQSYTIRYDRRKQKTYDFQNYSYQDSLITHFDGIAPNDKGGYNFTGTGVSADNENFAFFAETNSKGKIKWSIIAVPGAKTTTGNSVWDKTVVGIFTTAAEGVEAYISY